MDPLASPCTATAKGTRQRCQRRVIGGGVCWVHGGAAPQVEARRAVRILEGRALLAGQVVEERDPGEALLAAARDADQMLQRVKGQLDAGRLTGADLTAFGEWIDRVGRLSKLVIDTRLEERRTRLSEQQAKLLVSGLNWFITTSIPTAQHANARQQLAQMLRALDRGEVPGERPAIEAGP